MRKTVSLFLLLIIWSPTSYSLAQNAQPPLESKKPWQGATERERLRHFQDAMRSSILEIDGVWILGKGSSPYCEGFLGDLLNDKDIEVVEPLAKFETADDPLMANYKSCDCKAALHLKYDDMGRSRTVPRTLSEIGTQAFRYYGALHLGEGQEVQEVIYSESRPVEKSSYHFAGYTALDPENCAIMVLAPNRPTTFRVNQGKHKATFADNFLVKWHGRYVDIDVSGMAVSGNPKPFGLTAHTLTARAGAFRIDCNWKPYSMDAANHPNNASAGERVPRDIVK